MNKITNVIKHFDRLSLGGTRNVINNKMGKCQFLGKNKQKLPQE